jgi:hypothetical protein
MFKKVLSFGVDDSPCFVHRLTEAGCVAAAHQVLAATDSAEALGEW